MSVLCALCDSEKTSKTFEVEDSVVSKRVFSVWFCQRCGVSFTHPFLSKKELLPYYNTKEYQSYKKQPESFFDILYNLVRLYNTKYKARLISTLICGPLLDYGSGSGFFSSYCRKKDLLAFDHEPINPFGNNNKWSVDAKTLIKQKGFYSVITLWHVLEHTNFPHKKLLLLKPLLKKEGHLVVALPNVNSYDNIYYKKHWAGYDLPRHRFHFNPLSFRFLCNMVGLKITKSFPLFYDSYYVSYLSEKNKHSSFSFIKGLYTGCLSNSKAKTTKNHSSLIYILKIK